VKAPERVAKETVWWRIDRRAIGRDIRSYAVAP